MIVSHVGPICVGKLVVEQAIAVLAVNCISCISDPDSIFYVSGRQCINQRYTKSTFFKAGCSSILEQKPDLYKYGMVPLPDTYIQCKCRQH